ncbi:MAG: 3D-(3,5/4)-trihydroxycyclohexane-1,2-dione acylhydrolase (decyclizing) [Christensenellales bacterium]|jgi:3D-(3,5/4)-trihydroxycyclohexane-1,2-dione acylhydrolase (decyclizing)|nr:3D-(3,5/4)-trihydroxycyclohexane-1,2-dione acylhydrolase (decyclizing) [Clostridiales bacterium]
MKTIKMTVGEAIIKFLDNQYVSFDGQVNKFVERAFTVFGHGCVLGTGEALAMAEHSITVMQGKNEQGMAQAAISYAKQNNRRKIIPCFSSIGPGAANMVTAAATATVNNIPLLLFPGDTFATRQPDPVLQQVEQSYDPGITTNDAFKPVVKYFDRVYRPEMVMTAMINAMRTLTDPAETGAVCIALPQDTQAESFEFPVEFFKKRVHKINRQKPSDIEDAVNTIAQNKYPLIIMGGGARYSEAGEKVAEFAKKYNIPIAETQAGKGVIPSSHALNLGGIGVTGNSAANELAKKADVVIGLGTRFSDFTTASKSLYPHAQIVAVNLSRYHAMKMEAVSVIGDVKASLELIETELDKLNYKSAYSDEITEAKAKWDEEMKRLSSIRYGKGFECEIPIKTPSVISDFIEATGGEICQTSAIAKIREIIDDDAIIVGASGSLPGCLQRMWTTDTPYTYNMEYGYSCMGYEIAGALGAKMAEPQKEVYAFAGDGSYLMLHSEMVTAIQEGLKINILLFDNGGFGCINNLQMSNGIDSVCTEFRYRKDNERIPKGEFLRIDYAASAKGYGYITYQVKTMDELEKALIDSKKKTLPVLIDIKVLPKTMTNGYGGWWNVGCSTAPRNHIAQKAIQEKHVKLQQARKY